MLKNMQSCILVAELKTLVVTCTEREYMVKLQLKELEKDFALYVDPNLIFNTHYEKEVNIVNINKLLGLIKRSHIHPHNET